jgi:hypothetical protein
MTVRFGELEMHGILEGPVRLGRNANALARYECATRRIVPWRGLYGFPNSKTLVVDYTIRFVADRRCRAVGVTLITETYGDNAGA